MEEHPGFGFDEFSVEMEEFELKKLKKFDRIWRISEGGSMCCIPMIHDDTLYFNCCNFNIYAVDLQTGKLKWRFKTNDIVFESSPVYWEGMVYAGSFDRFMYALDAKTGRLIWKYETSDKVNSKPVIYHGRLYFASKDRNVYCLDARTGEFRWKFTTQDEVASSPAIRDGKLYIGSFDRNFYCIDAEKGTLVWKFATQGEVYHANVPLIHEGIVYFTSFDNNLYAVNAQDGRLKWKLRTAEYGNAYAPELYGDRLYLVTRDGNLLAITLDGKIDWKFNRMYVPSVPAFKDGRIYVGFEDQNLYCLDTKGKLVWKFQTQGPIWLTSVFWRELVIFPCWDCNVYALDMRDASVVWKFRTEGSPSYLPPANDEFEISIKKPVQETGLVDQQSRKKYDLNVTEHDNSSQYKSRVTYQMSTQYQSRGGKYQVDSDEEAL